MPSPCPDPFNLAAYVLAQAHRQPDKIALAVLGPARAERWSYGRLDATVRATATGLLARGLVPGDRVLLRLGNTPDFPVAFLACAAVGLIPVPTSAGLTVPEITKLVSFIAPTAILAHPGIALPVQSPCPVITDLAALADHAPAAFLRGDPDRPAYIVFTSGTSGQPRAVVHAHRAVWARRMMWDGWYGLTSEDRLLHAGAFNWTFTLGSGLLDPWAVGATALIPAEGTASTTLPLLLKRHDASIFAAAPGVFRKVLAAGVPLNLPKLRHGLSAGEKLPEALRARWQAATGTTLHEALGMSECSTFISGSPGRPAPSGTLGFAQPGRQLAVLGSDGPVSPGEVGSLGIHRSDPGLMLGYLTGAGFDLPLTGDWFETGDLVSQGPDCAFLYHGRRDDLLTTGGFRISPLEIEAAFHDASALEDCAAMAVEVKADTFVLALAYTGAADPATLREWAETRLAPYKQPRLYLPQPSLPRTSNGKLDRRALATLLKGAS